MAAGGGGGGSRSIEAGKAFVRVDANDKPLKAKLAAIPAQLKSIGSKIAGIGAGLFAGGASILGPIAGLANYFVEAGSAATDMAERLNTSTETITALGYAAELAGTDLSDVEGSISKLQKKIADGEKIGDLDLGSLKDLSVDEQLNAVAEAIKAVQNPTEQAALAMEFFGKSGRKMLPFLKEGAAGLARLKAQAGADGAIIGKDEAEKADRIGDAFSRIWTVIKSAGRAIGGAILPDAGAIEGFAQSISNAGQQIRQFISDNAATLKIVAMVGAALVAGGAAFIAIGGTIALVGAAISGMIAAWGALSAAVTFSLSPIGLVVAGLTAISAAAAYLIWNFTSLGEIATSAFGGIAAAIAKGDLAGAMNIAWLGIKTVWQGGIGWLRNMWTGFKYFFIDSWREMTNFLAEGFYSAMAELQEELGDNWFGRRIKENLGDARKALDEVKAMNEAERASDKAAQTAEVAGNLAEYRKTKAELDAAIAKAHEAKEAVAVKAEEVKKVAAATTSVFGGPVRGAFANNLTSGAFAFGEGKSIADNTKETAKNTGDMNKKLDKLQPAMVVD